ncbi:DUF309 domain-containing protein [Paenibacillus taiwanensis]|uniref:DUF309 domain-containing protein n=1 Tax=Paenibacillus taiwanensis TaxID=401638 RepID=UPI0003FB020D|nr:DUF309 domain-containing protein [Paenibacillus taiwanensis]
MRLAPPKEAVGAQMTNNGYDRLYVAFVKLFNEERDYYACHDVMEELWLEEGRKPIYQGLLQVAVGLHHWHNGNNAGAVKLWEAALHKLDSYADLELGIRLDLLRHDTLRLLEALQRSEDVVPLEHLTITIADYELADAVLACSLSDVVDTEDGLLDK